MRSSRKITLCYSVNFDVSIIHFHMDYYVSFRGSSDCQFQPHLPPSRVRVVLSRFYEGIA